MHIPFITTTLTIHIRGSANCDTNMDMEEIDMTGSSEDTVQNSLSSDGNESIASADSLQHITLFATFDSNMGQKQSFETKQSDSTIPGSFEMAEDDALAWLDEIVGEGDDGFPEKEISRPHKRSKTGSSHDVSAEANGPAVGGISKGQHSGRNSDQYAGKKRRLDYGLTKSMTPEGSSADTDLCDNNISDMLATPPPTSKKASLRRPLDVEPDSRHRRSLFLRSTATDDQGRRMQEVEERLVPTRPRPKPVFKSARERECRQTQSAPRISSGTPLSGAASFSTNPAEPPKFRLPSLSASASMTAVEQSANPLGPIPFPPELKAPSNTQDLQAVLTELPRILEDLHKRYMGPMRELAEKANAQAATIATLQAANARLRQETDDNIRELREQMKKAMLDLEKRFEETVEDMESAALGGTVVGGAYAGPKYTQPVKRPGILDARE